MLRLRTYHRIALLLAGSALLLSSCHKEEATLAADQQVRMTEYSENLSVITSENGQKSYHFTAPLMEGYTLAREPYREFRKGVRIVTYNKGDSLSTVDATLTANYAIYYEKRELWEAKGNVVIVKEDGKRLYTQQLFWNATTKRIYSNVDTRIVDGVDNFIGEGFESDDELRKWKFRRMKGRMTVEVTPTGERTQEIPLAPTPLEEEERAGRLAPLSDRSSDPSADSALSSASEASGVTGATGSAAATGAGDTTSSTDAAGSSAAGDESVPSGRVRDHGSSTGTSASAEPAADVSPSGSRPAANAPVSAGNGDAPAAASAATAEDGTAGEQAAAASSDAASGGRPQTDS
ncbi:MAG: LPS export ABC transporter periplasmic protein LptC [Alistipes sp.]|uniref:LPS export ABC transporter periplasmic protein LptC n=1 Tax=Alistipes sp. TaxID=1872444 RepID=UPI0011CA3561|nr:LPS export ABC transporter periplasmic protein LptC [Alistipes sp.]MBS6100053.1 LPS export ABC transporter periplasmic protein LptC [Alistipes sp.]HJI19345.1 LPS export ABC transporter periplasmic protein LptC [Rikenellaceae bacterium]